MSLPISLNGCTRSFYQWGKIFCSFYVVVTSRFHKAAALKNEIKNKCNSNPFKVMENLDRLQTTEFALLIQR